jgi:hypothetical protein
MDNNCKDCLLVKALDERVEKMEDKCIDHSKRIGVLESAVAVSDERFKQVFQKLDEIIQILRTKDAEVKIEQNRLPNYVWSVATIITAGIVMAVVNLFMKM